MEKTVIAIIQNQWFSVMISMVIGIFAGSFKKLLAYASNKGCATSASLWPYILWWSIVVGGLAALGIMNRHHPTIMMTCGACIIVLFVLTASITRQKNQ